MTDLRKDVFQSADDFNKYQTAPMVSLQKGGQFGHFTDISQYVASANYIRKNLICVLMAAPLGFDDLEIRVIFQHFAEPESAQGDSEASGRSSSQVHRGPECNHHCRLH